MMKELQEKYKDNPQEQQMEVMKLYRDYGVNPLGGCLPLLLQFPIFIGLYSMLEYAAELRGPRPLVGEGPLRARHRRPARRLQHQPAADHHGHHHGGADEAHAAARHGGQDAAAASSCSCR
jgi:YidC/Oxa1 family membrane protein insertase